MNTITEQLEPLRLQNDVSQQSQYAGKPGQTGQAGSFDSILNSQLGTPAAASHPGSAGMAGNASLIASMLLGDTGENSADSEIALLDVAYAKASGALDLFDSYARSIGNDASLRESYSLLEGIDSQVKALRQSTTGLRARNQDFDNLLNNLEAMTVTEKFKFNRGDYQTAFLG